jgi:hypothetical protein
MKKYGEEVVVHVLGFSEYHNDTFLNDLSLMVTILIDLSQSASMSGMLDLLIHQGFRKTLMSFYSPLCQSTYYLTWFCDSIKNWIL